MGWARIDWNRSTQYPTVKKFQYTEVLTQRFGFIEDTNGIRPVSAARLAVQLRELARSSPTLLLKALDNPNSVSFEGGVKVGQTPLPAVSLKDGRTTFIIMFDRATHLPAIIRTFDDDQVKGDSGFDLALGGWRVVAGVKIAHAMSYKLNDAQVARVAYTSVVANPTFGPDTFATADHIKAAAKPPANGSVPFQSILRQLYAGNIADDDPTGVLATNRLKLVELAPDVQQVVGGAQNSLVVAMKDGIAVFDAPGGEPQSRWTINAAKAKYPGKPIKYLILTHHHMEHASGVRTYVAEGATIIVPRPDKIFCRPCAAGTRACARRVAEQAGLGSGRGGQRSDDPQGRRRGNPPLPHFNPHVDGMLIGHVVKPNIVWVTDLLTSPEATKGPGSRALGLALERYEMKNATIASGNGGAAKQSDLANVLAE